jgi:hypothetical protein
MKGTISLAVLEKKMVHEMRNTINQAEDKIDLEKQFSNVMKHFLSRVFERQHMPVEIHDDDIVFIPKTGTHFRISGDLIMAAGFRDLWVSSDLKSVIGRVAASVNRKYLHLTRHREKARFKIKN